ncbi:hypothetical protein AB0A76_10480 [Streptomyces exfoliatus]|uniref:HEAT repeat domain-containing protein n=1 Tax=Streptomyces exfoliatus TaxID=1905 RepID=A0ABV3CTT3_STREX
MADDGLALWGDGRGGVEDPAALGAPLERWDVRGLRLVLAAFAHADDSTADYLDGAISDVCCRSDEDFARLRELVSTLVTDADAGVERQATRILGGGGIRR